ncbi:MAG: DUF2061 domain-containing protein [Bacteroidota bacterium]
MAGFSFNYRSVPRIAKPKRGSVTTSLLKSFSWRLWATADTLLLAWWVTGELSWAFSIGTGELMAKFAMYYLHERAWAQVPWGRKRRGGDRPARSVSKALSWRTIATLTTVGLALLITGDTETALSIGGLELGTKLLLYYLHERLWTRIIDHYDPIPQQP